MSDVSILVEGETLVVKTPYNTDFVAQAKRKLAGRWDGISKVWRFRLKDEQNVRRTVIEVFGSDGTTTMEVVDVLVTVGNGFVSTRDSEIVALGRRLVRKYDRDTRPTFMPGVALHEGPDFPSRAGSRKYPIVSNGDTSRVLLVQDVPRPVAERAVKEQPSCFALLSNEDVERAALLRERTLLLDRLAELNSKLGPNEASLDEPVEE